MPAPLALDREVASVGGRGSFVLHHLGVAVPSVEEAVRSYGEHLGYRVAIGPYDDWVQKARICLVATRDEATMIELVAPLSENAGVATVLRRRGSGPYHLCYEVPDLDLAIDHLRRRKWLLVQPPVAAVAFDRRKIAWLFTPTEELVEILEGAQPTVERA